MPDFRRSKDGSLFQPRRGEPKGCPDGYERDEDDEWKCVPILEPCEYREKKIVRSRCCPGGKKRTMCHVVNYLVTYANCEKCKGKTAWILDYQKKYGLQVKVPA